MAAVSLSAVATSAPIGRGSFHHMDVEPLRGAHVVVVVDRDEKGDLWARQVKDALAGVAASVPFVRAVAGKDLSDHVASSGTRCPSSCPTRPRWFQPETSVAGLPTSAARSSSNCSASACEQRPASCCEPSASQRNPSSAGTFSEGMLARPQRTGDASKRDWCPRAPRTYSFTASRKPCTDHAGTELRQGTAGRRRLPGAVCRAPHHRTGGDPQLRGLRRDPCRLGRPAGHRASTVWCW